MPIPDLNKVSLLLPLTGANNGTTFTDYSLCPKIVTRVGDAKTVTAQSKFSAYGSSAYFDGNGDYLSVADNPAFHLSNGNFCIGAWTRPGGYPSEANANMDVCSRDITNQRSYGLYLSGVQNTSLTSINFVGFVNNATPTTVSSAFAFSLNTWYFVSVCRFDNKLYLGVDGAILNAGGTAFSITIQNASTNLLVGARNFGTNDRYWFNGHMQDLIFAKGATWWTSNFTPPARMTQRTLTRTNIGVDSHVYDRAVLFDWDAGDGSSLSTSVAPDSEGDFVADDLIDLEYGVAFIKDGCGPICRGPFEVDPDD